MFRHSSISVKFFSKRHYWLSKCFEINTASFLRCSSSFYQRDNTENQHHKTYGALALSFIGAVSYYLYNDEINSLINNTYKVHALKKQPTE